MKYIMTAILCIMLLISCQTTQDNSPTINENETSGEVIQILALGDSITAGYNLPLESAYPAQLQELLGEGYEVINAGVSGNTSAQLLDRIELYIQDDDLPEIAIVTIGGNDGLRGLSLGTLEGNINTIIDKLQEKDITVVLSGMRIPLNFGIRYASDFENLYPDIAGSQDVYFFPHFLADVEGVSSLNLSDRIHPNESGYQIIAENIYDFLLDEKLIQ